MRRPDRVPFRVTFAKRDVSIPPFGMTLRVRSFTEAEREAMRELSRRFVAHCYRVSTVERIEEPGHAET